MPKRTRIAAYGHKGTNKKNTVHIMHGIFYETAQPLSISQPQSVSSSSKRVSMVTPNTRAIYYF